MALLRGGEERWAPGQGVCAQHVCVPSMAPVDRDIRQRRVERMAEAQCQLGPQPQGRGRREEPGPSEGEAGPWQPQLPRP